MHQFYADTWGRLEDLQQVMEFRDRWQKIIKGICIISMTRWWWWWWYSYIPVVKLRAKNQVVSTFILDKCYFISKSKIKKCSQIIILTKVIWVEENVSYLTNQTCRTLHVLLWIPTHSRAKAGRPARTYIQQLCEDTGCCPEDLPRAMNDREEWRERVRDIRATSAIWWWWW